MSAIDLRTASPDVLTLQADAFQLLINVLELKKSKVLTKEQADLIVEQTLVRLGLAEAEPETAPSDAVPPEPEPEPEEGEEEGEEADDMADAPLPAP